MPFEEEAPPSAPEWIVTFSDMVSLLVTFFVLLMTFATTDPADKMSGNQRLSARQGLFERTRGEAVSDPPRRVRADETQSSRGATSPHTRPERDLLENLEHMGQRQRSNDVAFDFSQLGHGIVVTFGPECSFGPGASDVTLILGRKLGELGRLLEHYPVELAIEGHVDGRFKSTIAHSSPESLAFERAVRAADILLRDSDFPVERVHVLGLGAVEPRCSEETLEGRLCNRRVEVRVHWLRGSASE
ncbi:MAG: hypothetical protein IPJ77_06260 [Planctomycetes bacterium]|nr:hypothetical protein [Planctomycetota bacterium]